MLSGLDTDLEKIIAANYRLIFCDVFVIFFKLSGWCLNLAVSIQKNVNFDCFYYCTVTVSEPKISFAVASSMIPLPPKTIPLVMPFC